MKPSLSEAMKDPAGSGRGFQRYAVSMSVLVQPLAGAAGTRRREMRCAALTNISLSGLVFVSSRAYPPGSVVEVQIGLGAQVYLVQAVVRRSRLLSLPGRRAFQCAAQFVRSDSISRFIPALARSLFHRFGPQSLKPDAAPDGE